MVLAKKIKDKKVNIEFNKEFIKIIEEKIKLSDSQFIDNSLKELHPSDSADIIENLFELKKIPVEEILTPRSVIFALEHHKTVRMVMDEHEDLNFSRIPIYKENIDNIIGIVYKDTLLEAMADDFFEKKMETITEPVDTVFEKQTVESVLNNFTKTRSHMYIVKDEFGGTTGIVTLEDCIETLLGVEIMDESDTVADMRELAKDQLRQKRRTEENNNT